MTQNLLSDRVAEFFNENYGTTSKERMIQGIFRASMSP